MKNILLFALLLICLFFSCQNDQETRNQIDRAEKLVKVNPDSAYTLLNNMAIPDNLNDKLFARWCMIYGQAADKLYKDMPYVEQLTRALEWYKKHGTMEQQAWIGLYLGRSYVEDKLYLPATNTYSDALDIALEGEAYNVAGYICSYIADLYTYTSQISEERCKFEEAADYFKKAGNIRSYALALRDIAKTWAFEDSCSLALNYMLKADSIITDLNDSVGMSSIANGLGNIYETMEDIETAKNYLLRSIRYDTSEITSTYLALSCLFYTNSDLDSARYYLKMADRPSTNKYISSDKFYIGYLIEKEANKTEKALQYLEKHKEALDLLYDKEKQVDIIDAEKRHNLSILLNKNKELQISKSFLLYTTVIIILILSLIYQNRDRKRLKKINEQQLLLEEKENRLKELNEEMYEKGTEHENSELIRQEIDLVRQELVILRDEKFQTSIIVKKIKKQCQKVDSEGKNILTLKDWKRLIILIKSIYPNVKTFMEKNTFNLTDTEIEVCYLSFLKIGLNEEAILLNINPDSVSKRRFRTRQKLGLANNETSIYDFILKY